MTAPRDEAEARAKLIAIAQSLGLVLPESVASGEAMLEDGEGSDGDG